MSSRPRESAHALVSTTTALETILSIIQPTEIVCGNILSQSSRLLVLAEDVTAVVRTVAGSHCDICGLLLCFVVFVNAGSVTTISSIHG